jgi:hypothetical protein
MAWCSLAIHQFSWQCMQHLPPGLLPRIAGHFSPWRALKMDGPNCFGHHELHVPYDMRFLTSVNGDDFCSTLDIKSLRMFLAGLNPRFGWYRSIVRGGAGICCGSSGSPANAESAGTSTQIIPGVARIAETPRNTPMIFLSYQQR